MAYYFSRQTFLWKKWYQENSRSCTLAKMAIVTFWCFVIMGSVCQAFKIIYKYMWRSDRGGNKVKYNPENVSNSKFKGKDSFWFFITGHDKVCWKGWGRSMFLRLAEERERHHICLWGTSRNDPTLHPKRQTKPDFWQWSASLES